MALLFFMHTFVCLYNCAEMPLVPGGISIRLKRLGLVVGPLCGTLIDPTASACACWHILDSVDTQQNEQK